MALERTTLFTGLALWGLTSLIGCGDGKEPGSTPSPSTSSTDPTPTGTTPTGAPTVAPPAAGAACPTAMDDAGNLLVMANEANNYTFSSTLSFPPVSVAPQSELVFDWSQVTLDFLGHPLDPAADVDNVLVMLWKLTQADLEAKLNADQLIQQELAILASAPTEGTATSKRLFEFGTPGLMPGQAPFAPEEFMPFLDITAYPPETNTYTVMIGSGESATAGTRMIQTFKLDAASTTTDIVMTNASTTLEHSVELEALQKTPVPVGSAAITVDWSAMATTALGTEFTRNTIGTMVVVHLTQTPAELEGTFLDLVDYNGDIQADQVWELAVPSGDSATMSDAVDKAGANFTGIDETGTWMLALFCFDCRNPAPWYLTFMTPCGG